jgi:hypothetical protein
MVFLEIFNAPAAVLKIGESIVKIPLDWNMIICDPECGQPEIIPITSLNDRGFSAFTLNPLAGYMPDYQTIDMINVFADVKFHFPKMKQGQILAVPLTFGVKPKCAFFVKDTTKIPDILDIGHMW